MDVITPGPHRGEFLKDVVAVVSELADAGIPVTVWCGVRA